MVCWFNAEGDCFGLAVVDKQGRLYRNDEASRKEIEEELFGEWISDRLQEVDSLDAD